MANESLFINPVLISGIGPLNAAVKTMAKSMEINDPAEVLRRINSGEWIVSAAKVFQVSFNPVTFIGKGWSFAEAREPRSAALGLLHDYEKVTLSTSWLEGRSSVDGETRRRRILADTTHAPLNLDHFLDLWTNKEKIPESWKKVGLITFDGDVLLRPDGSRGALYLCWYGGAWVWGYSWLGDVWSGYGPAAVLAS